MAAANGASYTVSTTASDRRSPRTGSRSQLTSAHVLNSGRFTSATSTALITSSEQRQSNASRNRSSLFLDSTQNSNITSTPVVNLANFSARRNSASALTSDVTVAAGGEESPGAIGRIPAKNELSSFMKKVFFYSKVWRERKARQSEQSKSDEGSGIDDEIVINRDLSRRTRNSFSDEIFSVRDINSTNVTAYLSARVEAEKPIVTQLYVHSSAIAKALSKMHMLDISVEGNDGATVRASRFILACYSPVLENILFKQIKSEYYNEEAGKLKINFCNSNVLGAAVYHCFCGELPPEFNIDGASENIARNLAQLDYFANVFKIRALGEIAYRAGRRLINRRAVLACAIFDELSCCEGLGVIDSIKRYALDTIRDMPRDTLLGGGVQWMKEESLNQIMQDQDMDVDEFYMFIILRAWEKGANRTEDRLAKAREMAKHIELKFIASELLQSQIRMSGYFQDESINDSIRLIEDTLANRDPHEMERVIVEGAGTPIVNGIYVRVDEEMGMSDDEILFVKEASDGFSDVGLYLYGQRWHIAMCTDYSNCFYSSRYDPHERSNELVPRSGWTTTHGGEEPAPTCTYLPATRCTRTSLHGSVLAPNLEEMIDPSIAQKRRSVCFDKTQDDTVEKRFMTLEQMMNLPEDREHYLTDYTSETKC